MGVSVEDLNTLKVAEIKEHLKKLDLPTTGFKKELVDRLKEDKIKRLTKDLHRIEKFGIAENNPIAIELGLIEVEKKPIKTQKKNGGKAKKNKNSRYHPFKK